MAGEQEEETDRQEGSLIYSATTDRLGEHAYKNYREPVVVKTNSGRIVVGVHAGNRQSWPERSGQDLVVRYSDDQGKSWSPLVVAAEHGNYSCQSHGLVYDAQKTRLIFLYVTYNWDYSSVKGRGYKATAPLYSKMHAEGKRAMSAYMVTSGDEGKTWSTPLDITTMVGGDAHFGAGEGRQLTLGKHAGRLVLAGGDDRTIDSTGKLIRKRCGVWISDDHGEKWRFVTVNTPTKAPSVRDYSCEGRVSELPDGSLVYTMRSRRFGRQISFSKDGGKSWTVTTTAKDLVGPACNGSMRTLRDREGKLTQTVFCSLPQGRGRSNGTIHISKDGGRTWPERKLITRGPFAYSALVQIDTELLGLFYETNHHQDIRFIKLSISKLLAKPNEQSRSSKDESPCQID